METGTAVHAPADAEEGLLRSHFPERLRRLHADLPQVFRQYRPDVGEVSEFHDFSFPSPLADGWIHNPKRRASATRSSSVGGNGPVCRTLSWNRASVPAQARRMRSLPILRAIASGQ